MTDEEQAPKAGSGGVVAGVATGVIVGVVGLGIIVCLAGVVIIGALTVLGNSISNKFETIAQSVQPAG